MPKGFQEITKAPVGTRDLYSLAVDPADFDHILVSFHSPWKDDKIAEYWKVLMAENWSIHYPPPSLKGGYGMAIFFLYDPTKKIGDSQTWLFTTQQGGFFKTTDRGKTWTHVYEHSMTHGGNQLYRSSDGALYSGGYQYPVRSTDNGSSCSKSRPDFPIVGIWGFVEMGNKSIRHARIRTNRSLLLPSPMV